MDLKRHPGLSRPAIPEASAARQMKGKILVVDDDSISRTLLTTFLERRDFQVVVAEGVDQAIALLETDPLEGIDCVVTDYQMPEKDGLWLLEWLHGKDPHLATIMVTAQGEKHLVTATLRQGACDCLDKPIDPRALDTAALKAVALTRHRRCQARAQSDIESVGKFQQEMVSSALPSSGLDITLCYRPMHEAGGDHFIALPLGDERFLILATDVSGHDLRSAYFSAYFQGFVRGMLDTQTPIQSILERFNQRLLEETAKPEAAASGKQGTSVAVAAVLVDRNTLSLESINCGFPAPVYSDGAGRVLGLSALWSSPLGWFPDTVELPSSMAIDPGSTLYLWTDGLEDVAAQLGVAPMACAFDFFRAQAKGASPAWIQDAGDDILVTKVALTPPVEGQREFVPIVVAWYPGSDYERIDTIQETWFRSLRLALPFLTVDRTYDIMLCLREVVINALKHGCRGQQDQMASLMISWEPHSSLVRVIVSDPGPGHSFDWRQHKQRAENELIDEHRGLMLIDAMTQRFETRSNGAWVEMDFEIDPTLKEMAS